MVRKIVIAIAFILAIGLNAQDGSVSPYSYFGIGNVRANSSIENQMMGGIGIYTDSIHASLSNPSGYSKLRLTTYAGGISRKELSLKSASARESSSVSSLNYLSIGFPIAKRLGLGFGLNRRSAVGYNFESTVSVSNGDNSSSDVRNLYSGSGGLNKVYVSLGYELIKNLSIGVTANYNFGNFDNSRAQTIENVELGTSDNRFSSVSGVDLNYALNYENKISDKHTFYTSLRVNTQANLISRNRRTINSFSSTSGSVREEFEVDLTATGLDETDLKIPATTTFGLGFGENKKWFLGGEYSFQELNTFSNVFIEVDDFSYQDAKTFALGGYYIPDYTSFTSYFKRIIYRAGMRYNQTGMVVNQKEINNFGITFGVGLPLATNTGSFSNVNVGFEIGRRGTTAAGLIEETYFKFNVGLSLNDRWFQKRKIN